MLLGGLRDVDGTINILVRKFVSQCIPVNWIGPPDRRFGIRSVVRLVRSPKALGPIKFFRSTYAESQRLQREGSV
jgi:hypothetical protein